MNALSYTPRRIASFLQSRFRSEQGASLLEYAMIVGLIAVVAIIAVVAFSDQVETKFDNIGSTMTNLSGDG